MLSTALGNTINFFQPKEKKKEKKKRKRVQV
jgi:hypothetical protein